MPELSGFDDRQGFEHPYLDALPAADWLWGWREGSALAMLLHGAHSPLLVALGAETSDVQALLARSVEVAPSCRITLQRSHQMLLTGEISNWDWMGIDRDNVRLHPEMDVLDLGLSHDDEINEFLATASPTASKAAGNPEIITWHGLRDHAGLVCVGAATRWKSGAAHLVSIATHPRGRGRGYAKSVTASLTDMLFRNGEPRVTLGLYADNKPAIAAYTSVGYRLLESFSSSSRP